MKPATGFLFLPKWRVVVCEACGYCLRPRNDQRVGHLREAHGIQLTEARALRQRMNEHCDDWLKPDEHPVDPDRTPVPGLTICKGWQCLLCTEEPHFETSARSMRDHLRCHTSPLGADIPILGASWTKCDLQTFFSGNDRHLFLVSPQRSTKRTSKDRKYAPVRIPFPVPVQPSTDSTTLADSSTSASTVPSVSTSEIPLASTPTMQSALTTTSHQRRVFDGFQCLQCTKDPYGSIDYHNFRRHLQQVHGMQASPQPVAPGSTWTQCKLVEKVGQTSTSRLYEVVPREHNDAQATISFTAGTSTSPTAPQVEVYDGFQCLKCTRDPYSTMTFGDLRSHLHSTHGLSAGFSANHSGLLWSKCKLKRNPANPNETRGGPLYIVLPPHDAPQSGKSRIKASKPSTESLPPAKTLPSKAASKTAVLDGLRCLMCTGDPYCYVNRHNLQRHLQNVHKVKPSSISSSLIPLWSECKMTKNADSHSPRTYVAVAQQVPENPAKMKSRTSDPFPFPHWTFPSPAGAEPEVLDGFQCLKCAEHPYASVNFDRLRGHADSVHGLKIDDRERAKGSLWSDCQVKNNPDKSKELGRSYVLVQQEVKEQHDDHSKPESAQTQDSPKPPSPAPGPVYTIHHGFQCLKCTETDLLTTDFEQMRRHLREDHGLTLAQLRSSSEPLWSERKFSVLSSDPHPTREAAGPSAGPSQAEHFPSRAASEDSVQFLGVFIATGDKRPLEETLPSRAASEDPDEPLGDSLPSVDGNLATADPDETLQPSAEQQGGEETEVTRAASEESLQPFAGEEHVTDETFIERALSEEPADSWQPSTPSEEDPTSKATTPPATTSKEEDEPMASAPHEEPLESLPSRAVSEDPYETPDELTLSDEERLETQTRPSHSASEAPHEALEGVLRSIDERLQRDAVPNRAGSEDLPESKGDIPLSSEADEPLGDLSQLSASAGVPVLDRHKDAAFYDFSFDDDEEDRIARSPSRPSKRARLIPRASSSASSSQGTIRARLGRDAASPGPSSAVLDSKTDPSNIPRSMLARSETPEFTLLSVRHGPVPEVSQSPEALRETRTLKKEKQKYREMFRDFCNHFDLSKQQACDILVHFDGRIEKARDSIDHWCVSMSRTYGVDSIVALEHVNAANGNLQAAESSIELSQRFHKRPSDGRAGIRRSRHSEKVQL